MQLLFTVLITIEFLIAAFHDLIHIPGWMHARQVKAALGMRKAVIGTIANAIPPGLALAFALYYYNKPKPAGVIDYWAIYNGIALVGAISMWYVPYFFGTSEQTRRMYSAMYCGTIQVLPPRGPAGDNPRPNLLHLLLHAAAIVTFVMALAMRFHLSERTN
jgi:hypothetical protein